MGVHALYVIKSSKNLDRTTNFGDFVVLREFNSHVAAVTTVKLIADIEHSFRDIIPRMKLIIDAPVDFVAQVLCSELS